MTTQSLLRIFFLLLLVKLYLHQDSLSSRRHDVNKRFDFYIIFYFCFGLRCHSEKAAGEIVQGAANRVPVDLAELHIYVPKANFSQSMESTWTNAITAAYPDIKVVISTIEKQLGL